MSGRSSEKKAVVGLGFDPSGPHLFGQPMCRGEDKGDYLTEELNRSCCFVTAATAIQVGRVASGQWIIVTWCGLRGRNSFVAFCIRASGDGPRVP